MPPHATAADFLLTAIERNDTGTEQFRKNKLPCSTRPEHADANGSSAVDHDQHRAFDVNTQKAGTGMAGRVRAGHGSREYRQCFPAHRSVSSQSTRFVACLL